MKRMYSFLLLCLGIALIVLVDSHGLILTYEGPNIVYKQKLKKQDLPSLRDRMESIIKSGNIAIAVEKKNDVVWLYLNDPCGRDYTDIDLQSDYLEVIQDLFPLKLTDKLKKSLKEGNESFIKTLGIEYIVVDKEIISKIDYETFEQYIL